MSLHDLLRRRQAAAVPPVPCSSAAKETNKLSLYQFCSHCSLSSLEHTKCKFRQGVERVANDPQSPASEAEIGLLLSNLRFDFTGAPLHVIDQELAGMIRLAMLPMSRPARAVLAALVDDHLGMSDGRQGLQTLLEKLIEEQGPANWLDGINAECQLVDDDAKFVSQALGQLLPSEQEQVVRRYVAAWKVAAEKEIRPHRKANAGRQAANQTLLLSRNA